MTWRWWWRSPVVIGRSLMLRKSSWNVWRWSRCWRRSRRRVFGVLVLPFGEIHPGQYGTLARHSRIANDPSKSVSYWILMLLELRDWLTFRDRARPWRKLEPFQCRRCCRKRSVPVAHYGFLAIVLLILIEIENGQFLKRFQKRTIDYEIKKLTDGEWTGLVGILVPKSIAGSQIFKRFSDDASENRSHHTARQWPFRHSGCPQIDVIGWVVNRCEMF